MRREVGDHPNVFYYLGRLDLDDHQYASAIQNLTQAAAKPPFPDTAYYLGYAYFKQGDLAAAEKWLKEASRLTPHDARVPYQLGLVYRKQGREQEAAKSLALSEELRQRDSKESRLRMECRQKLDQGLREEARAVCEQLYDPDDADKLTELGTIYGQHGDLEAALKPLRRAAELAPQSPQMQYNLALTYYQLNQFEQAREASGQFLKRWPDLFQLNSLYGAVLAKLGEDLPAYQALHHAHQLNPQDPETANLLYATTFGLAQKSKSAGQYADSLRYLEEASSLRPQEAEPHRRMAEIYSLTGRPAQAAAEKQKAERLARPGRAARKSRQSLPLLRIAICNRHSEQRLALLRRFHLVCLLGLGRVVIAPQPDHLFRKFRRALAGVVRALAEAEVEIVALQLQRIGHANIGQRPASVAVILLIL